MAVVQNSADGLYVAMPPAFGLTVPANFAHFRSIDADLGDPQHQKEIHLLQFDHHCDMSSLQNCQNTEAHTGAQVGCMGPLQDCQNAEAHTRAQVEICDWKTRLHHEQDQDTDWVALQEEKHEGSINCQNTEVLTAAQVEICDWKKRPHYEQDQDNNLMAVQQEEEHVGSIHGPLSLPAPSEQMAISKESNSSSFPGLNGSSDATFHPNDVADASHDTAYHPVDVNGSSCSSPPLVDERKRYNNDGIKELESLLSKLNPLAEEFVPPSCVNSTFAHKAGPTAGKQSNRKKKPEYISGRHHNISRTSRAQHDDCIRRTVYVSDIDQQVTEEQLAALFITCGQVVDCRICGDPNSVLRFAFVEFMDEVSARAALNFSGTMLGYYPVRVLPSKTAIIPVNPTLLPRSEYEREMCVRTIYCTNIDKKVTQADIKLFFESLCGEVLRLRLLGDYQHSTRIAFVEFAMAQSAVAALNCSGAILGSLPIRVSPSKTPVRPR